MKIGVALSKFTENYNLQDYLSSIQKSAEIIGQGLFVGPDYALANPGKVHSPEERIHILKYLRQLTKVYPHLCFVPGTMPIRVEGNQMAHVAPVLFGENEYHFEKQTDHGEGALAESNGLSYRRATGRPNVFNAFGKKIWLHICGDRGRKPESVVSDADLELILANDANAGFHFGIETPMNSRYIVLADSFKPQAEILFLDSNGQQQLLHSRTHNLINAKSTLKLFETQ